MASIVEIVDVVGGDCPTPVYGVGNLRPVVAGVHIGILTSFRVQEEKSHI